MADIEIRSEDFAPVVREVIDTIYAFASDLTIDFCGLVFTLWDLFIACLVAGLLGLVYWAFAH